MDPGRDSGDVKSNPEPAANRTSGLEELTTLANVDELLLATLLESHAMTLLVRFRVSQGVDARSSFTATSERGTPSLWVDFPNGEGETSESD